MRVVDVRDDRIGRIGQTDEWSDAMGAGMSGFPGPSDRSREKQLVHDHRYRQSGPASEQLHVSPPKHQPAAPKRAAPVRLWEWIVRRWNGD